MKTTTEHAAEIRATLKRAHGWTSRQVSVRAEYFSMGSAIRVQINDPAIPLPAVRTVAQRAESIDRCPITHEILSGGNTYVTVTYSREAQTILGRRHADAVQRAHEATDPGSAVLTPIEGTPFWLGRPHAGRLSLWNEHGYIRDAYSVNSMAETIGSMMVAREER